MWKSCDRYFFAFQFTTTVRGGAEDGPELTVVLIRKRKKRITEGRLCERKPRLCFHFYGLCCDKIHVLRFG
jgi:hypothetical protein